MHPVVIFDQLSCPIPVMKPITNPVCAIILATLAAGCVPTTRIIAPYACIEKLPTEEKVLFYYAPEPWSEQKFTLAEKRFASEKRTLKFTPREEYDLRRAGILNPLDSQYHKPLLQKGYSHILIITDHGGRQDASPVLSFTTLETSLSAAGTPTSHFNHLPENVSTASLGFFLYSLRDRRVYCHFEVNARISPVQVNNGDGGTNSYNLSNVAMAESKALSRGIRHLLKQCR